MSWLGEMPYPFKETLFRLYDAYSERYDFYESLGMGVGLKVPPPEVPYSATGMKYYMGELVDSITSLLQKSLDTRKLGDWQIKEPFSGINEYERDGLVELGIDAGAFFILDRPRLITDRRIIEAWYKVLNDYIRYPYLYLPMHWLAENGVHISRVFAITDWSEDSRYGGSRAGKLTSSVSLPSNHIAHYNSEHFKLYIDVTEVVNESPYITTGNWEIRAGVGTGVEFWDGTLVNTWDGYEFVVTMDGMMGDISYPSEIIDARNRIFNYPRKQNDPSVAYLSSNIYLLTYKVSAENLPDPQYQYLDS